jgi:hypothetical protein
MRGPLEERVQEGAPSSRNDEAAAGWYPGREAPPLGEWVSDLAKRKEPKWDSFSWLTVRALLGSANDVIARHAPTIVRDRRRRWIAAQRAAGAERADHGPATPGLGSFAADFVVDWTELQSPRLLIVGDPGEADASQYATIEPLHAIHESGPAWGEPPHKESDLMVVLSDVIYPAGDINDYVNGFYIPFAGYDGPIYALPGNHDWYDGLDGFMFHLCDAEPLPSLPFGSRGRPISDRLLRALWQRASRPDREALAPYVAERHQLDLRRGDDEPPNQAPPPRPVQPAPYFALELDELVLVAIDTGVTGEIDAEQGEWLLRVSQLPKPKVLLTGKPIWVSNEYHRCDIAWGGEDVRRGRARSVDDVVRAREHRYVAAIGGDVHNYQRYPVAFGDRRIQYIVSGGGGAYLSATHTIPTVAPTPHEGPPEPFSFSEEHFRCYPLRGDSLALFCRRAGPLLFKALVSTLLIAAVAAVLVLWVVDLDSGRRIAALVAGGGLAAVAAALALTATVGIPVVRDHRALVVPAVALLCAAGTVVLLVALHDDRATVAAAVAAGVPLVIVAGLVTAYATRGSLSDVVPDALVVVPALGLAPALWAPYDLGATTDALLYAMAPAAGAIVLFALARGLRRRDGSGPWPYRALVALLWTGVAAALIERFGDRWMGDALIVALAALAVIGHAVPHLGPGRRSVHQPRRDVIGPDAGAVVATAIAGAALVALDELAGARAPAVGAAGIAAVIGAVMAFAAAYLLVGRRMINPRTLYHLRTGAITPTGAALFVAGELGAGLAPTRPGHPSRTDRKRRGMARVVAGLRGSVAQIADTNEPPFYKSFLALDIADGNLEIRCWGVTGYADAERSPSLEDSVCIPLQDDHVLTDDVLSSSTLEE